MHSASGARHSSSSSVSAASQRRHPAATTKGASSSARHASTPARRNVARAAAGTSAAADARATAKSNVRANTRIRTAASQRTTARTNAAKQPVSSKRGNNAHAKRKIALAVVAFLVLVVLADHAMNFDKAYPGVHIGSVDCSGKTAPEIVALLEETYGSTYEQREVLVYASEDAQALVSVEGNEEVGDEDRISVAEARERRLAWSVYPETVAASFDMEDSAQAAVAEAHGITNIFSRIAIAFQGKQLDPIFNFGEAYRDFVNDVNATVGIERIDYDISVNQGVCSVTSGQDGVLMNDAAFQKKLVEGFLSQDDSPYSFVAVPEYAPVRITHAAAQAVCDRVNAAIADGANFVYENAGWNATSVSVGEWVTSEIVQENGSWSLVPCIDTEVARPVLLSHVKENGGEDVMEVSFSVSDAGNVVVHTNSSGKIPLVDDALAALDAALFGTSTSAPQDAALAADGQAVTVNISSAEAPSEMSFEDALYYGVIGEISTFTTEYTHGSASTESRNYNIHLAADLLNNSICAAGGKWSFHNVAGECDEARGFKEAGVIEEGVYSTAFGGGICQVATTVFNAAYDAGYYIDRRYNHTIYNSSYPAGRDAAVSWPDLDLIWSNDTSSDVLLTTSYTEGTITVTLWGVSPGRSVSTYVSDWEEGDKFKTKYVLNTDLAPTAYRVKTKGSDGRTIYVERTVYDKEGNQLSFQRFRSAYDAVNEVVEHGEEYEIPEDVEEKDKE